MTKLSFRLTDDFVEQYVGRRPEWGYADAAGNALGELTFIAKYSRIKGDGTKERWWEVCRRVVEGTFSIQKDWAKDNRLPWNGHKAQASAQEMYERMFSFKWTPPGRGLWVMGTPLVNEHRNSAALQNCAFISTADMTKQDPSYPFAFLMEASMLGVGVGFDDKGADKGFEIHVPADREEVYVIPDTREGWVESTTRLIDSFLKPDQPHLVFDYSEIRAAGEPIKTFGGTAAGPAPLMKLHEYIRALFNGRGTAFSNGSNHLTRTDIADIGNLIGVCVVSGNVRRSAELLMGRADDHDFLNLKNYGTLNPETWDYDPQGPSYRRKDWGWMSNNSVEAVVGQDLSHIITSIAHNGEPGVIWMDLTRSHGRLIDPPDHRDHRAAGYNPCAEQSLESGECCTLVETYLNRHESLDDFKRTLKFAYLYAKTVTLLPTHWPRTNAIMQRNRRIGTSVSGVANFTDRNGMAELRTWLDAGYHEVQKYDKIYSEWLCVRESIKTTTVKPSGTVSILAGESPGVHWAPGGEYYYRTQRFQRDHPLVGLCREARYRIEPEVNDPENTVVIYFPIHSKALRSEKDVSIYEKANLAVLAQRYWSDNSVSVTLSFDPVLESRDVGTVLHMYDGQLKTVSFLPMDNGSYPQMPYSSITQDVYEKATMELFPIDLTPLYDGDSVEEAQGEAYCTTDVCEVKSDDVAQIITLDTVSVS